jgi:hypothetical protein
MGLAIPRPTRLGDPRSSSGESMSPHNNLLLLLASPPLQPAATPLQHSSFEAYLKAQNKRNVRQIICYARKYQTVLQTGDAMPLVNVSAAVRRHVMEGLAAYAKFSSCYNTFWKDICAKYQLRWGNSNDDNLRYFTNYLHGNANLDVMMAWLKDALQKLPPQVGNILLYNTLTGLRFSECILSIKLIHTDLEHYANREMGILENFRYPEFIRNTKKSYLTVYDDRILKVAQNAKVVSSWEAIRKQLNRCGLKAHTKYCRAIFATYLRKCGIEQEIINIYQGRAPVTVFQAHYLKTNVKEDRERILKAVHQLRYKIEEG